MSVCHTRSICSKTDWRARLSQVVEKLYKSAHEYANLANRAGPVAKDVLLASQEWGMETSALHRLAVKAKRRDRTCISCITHGIRSLRTHKLSLPWSYFHLPLGHLRQTCCHPTTRMPFLSSLSRFDNYPGMNVIFLHYLQSIHISEHPYVVAN